MTKLNSRKRAGTAANADAVSGDGQFGSIDLMAGNGDTTGRFLVLLRQGTAEGAADYFNKAAGLRSVSTADTDSGVFEAGQREEADIVIFEELGVAVVAADPDQMGVLNSAAAGLDSSPVLAIEPERFVYANESIELPRRTPPLHGAATQTSAEYLRGYRDSTVSLIDSLLTRGQPANPFAETGLEAQADESQATWGLQVTQVLRSRFSGRGARVAVLDTGFDLRQDDSGNIVVHPDFAGRRIVSETFVPRESVFDGDGHGTHCTGTACGPLSTTPRYGIAHNAEIFIGKVLNNQGFGIDEWMMNGINWAVRNRCQIVSMSIGGRPGARFNTVFEGAARRALDAGTLIIAAAGNRSRRHVGVVNPVDHPANCPSIMAVASLDSQMRVASTSNGGLNPEGGQVDIAGPGVDVFSSFPLPRRYHTLSGTSMATPHVAGIAALYLEANPGINAQGLWNLLTRNSRRLPLSSVDVGAGLVQAP
jgi:subtilisin family serine protease